MIKKKKEKEIILTVQYCKWINFALKGGLTKGGNLTFRFPTQNNHFQLQNHRK